MRHNHSNNNGANLSAAKYHHHHHHHNHFNQCISFYNVVILLLALLLSYVNESLSLSTTKTLSSSLLSSSLAKKTNRSTYHGIKNIIGGSLVGKSPRDKTNKAASRIDPSGLSSSSASTISLSY